MSLSSLKRKSPAPEVTPVSVEQFINDAEAYAQGVSNVVDLRRSTTTQCPGKTRKSNATFSLSLEAKQKLDFWSRESGIPRSRLIRIWLQLLDNQQLCEKYLNSDVD